jgi:hypothetical protein
MGIAIGIGISPVLVQLGSGVSYWKNILAPETNYGMYAQQAAAKTINVFAPIDTDANCIVNSITPTATGFEGLSVLYSGISKAYFITLPDSRTGTYLAGSVKNDLTIQIGATCTLVFTGNAISFYSYMDNRGGYWNFSIDGGDPIKITRWAAAGAYVLTQVATGLTYGSHTIVGTFMGDDPDHLPSGGAGTGRGWICSEDITTGIEFPYKTFYVQNYLNCNYLTAAVTPAMGNTFNPGSIPEFAWSIKKLGAVYGTAFVPDHAPTTCIKFANLATDRTVKIDNVAVDLTATAYTFATPCTTVNVYQKYTGFNFNDNAQDLISVESYIDINFNLRQTKHKITVLQDIYATSAYIPMFPFSTSQFDNFVTSQKNEYATVKTDGSITELTEGRNFYWGYATNKSGSADLKKNIFGIRLKMSPDPYGSDGLTKYVWMQHRDTVLQKLYIQIAAAETIPTGTEYNFTADYIVNRIPDAYLAVKSKFGI